MLSEENIWPKKITVDKRIVKILSGSTYANFPSAIREIITNSYDADAREVKVDIDSKNEVISILDDGKGMNEDDFAFYLRIAGKSRKKTAASKTESKRKVIGQFGVGFLSALPYCKKYLIETKRKGTAKVVNATITSTEYFSDDFKSLDVDEIPIFGAIKENHDLFDEQFTRVRLVGFNKLTKSFFNGEYQRAQKRNTIYNFSPIELLKWELSEYLPLQYNTRDKVGEQLNSIIENNSILPFSVLFEGKQLFRNIHARTILEMPEEVFKIGNISFRFFINTDFKPISPTEGRFLMLRNLNVGVGTRETFGLGLTGKMYGKLPHLTGDVNIIEGLNELISVSRDKFNFSPDYERLKDFLRDRLRHWADELDAIKSMENAAQQLSDQTKVSSLKNLKKETFEKDLEKLEKRGYKLKLKSADPKSDNTIPISSSIPEKNQAPFKIQKEKREIVIPNLDETDYLKVIIIRDRKYKLVLDAWNGIEDNFPAVKFKNEVVLVNENYSLFQNKNQFDTFLKLHILFMEYLKSDKIGMDVYTKLVEDIGLTFK